VVDAATLEVIRRIPVGETPWGVAIGPAPGS
jgi:YVTN family beta-propeller protein